MEFKKCVRCGCFFMSDNNICYNCESKDRLDVAKLTNILDDNISFNSIQDLSIVSGINSNNLNRLIKENKISGFDGISL